MQGLSSVWNQWNHQVYKTLSGEFGSHGCLVKTEDLCYCSVDGKHTIISFLFLMDGSCMKKNLLEHGFVEHKLTAVPQTASLSFVQSCMFYSSQLSMIKHMLQ